MLGPQHHSCITGCLDLRAFPGKEGVTVRSASGDQSQTHADWAGDRRNPLPCRWPAALPSLQAQGPELLQDKTMNLRDEELKLGKLL